MFEFFEAILSRIIEGQYNLVLYTILFSVSGYAVGRYVRGNGLQKIVNAQAAQIKGLVRELEIQAAEIERLRLRLDRCECRHAELDGS